MLTLTGVFVRNLTIAALNGNNFVAVRVSLPLCEMKFV
jgi:hypothetical protein